MNPSAAQKQERNENMYINQCEARKNRKHLMSVAHLNVRSVASRENFYLLNRRATTNNFDIFTVSESWLNRTVCDADILILGYTTFRQDRGPYKRGGEVLIYVKDIYKACVIEKWSSVSESNFQQLWLLVQCKKFKSFLLFTVYRPPDAPIDFLENLSETFVDSLLHGSNVIILGDLTVIVLGVMLKVMHRAIFVRLLVYHNSPKPQQE